MFEYLATENNSYSFKENLIDYQKRKDESIKLKYQERIQILNVIYKFYLLFIFNSFLILNHKITLKCALKICCYLKRFIK